VDADSIDATADGGRTVAVHFDAGTGRARDRPQRLPAGRHRLTLTASDYQETKNTENTGPALPNTRVLRTTVTVP
jgi:hypothetical protein